MTYITITVISNKLIIQRRAHIKQEIVIRLTHEPMMNILPFTCCKSTEHAAHLPAWWRKYTPLPHPSA